MSRHGAVVAQGPFKPRVAGSNPAGGTPTSISERWAIPVEALDDGDQDRLVELLEIGIAE